MLAIDWEPQVSLGPVGQSTITDGVPAAMMQQVTSEYDHRDAEFKLVWQIDPTVNVVGTLGQLRALLLVLQVRPSSIVKPSNSSSRTSTKLSVRPRYQYAHLRTQGVDR
jgi:hypothetical protein